MIQSNAELGEGYGDIVIHTQDRVGIVIEIKFAGDGNLEKGCADALEQIEKRGYAAGLKEEQCRPLPWAGA